MSRRIACLGVLCAALLGAAPSYANISAPWRPGELASEPRGTALAQLSVLGETLRFDLRPLARGEHASVEVRYRLHNPGPARKQALRFVTPGVAGGAVLFDGQPVTSLAISREPIPAAWRKDLRTPALEGEGTLPFELDPQVRLLSFELPLAARSEHTLTVRYALRPAEVHRGDIYRIHQVLYLLAPARQFGHFGTLDVAVELPAGWRVRSKPALERRGDRLGGRFMGLPADMLAWTLARPASLASWGWILVALCGVLGLFAAVLVTRWLARGAARLGALTAFLAALGAGLVASVVAFGFTAVGQLLWSLLLDTVQLSPAFSYGLAAGYIFLGTPALVLWAIAMAITFAALRRRARARGV